MPNDAGETRRVAVTRRLSWSAGMKDAKLLLLLLLQTSLLAVVSSAASAQPQRGA